MLANTPIAAAPNACTTRNVSAIGSRPMSGTISTPDSAANVEPMIHAMRRTAAGLVALHVQQVGVVDDGPHRHAEPGEAEQRVQRGHGDDRDDGDDHLVVADVDVERRGRSRCPFGQELRHRERVDAVLDRAETLDERGSGRSCRRSSTPCAAARAGGRSAPSRGRSAARATNTLTKNGELPVQPWSTCSQ